MRIVTRAFVKNNEGKYLMTKHKGKNNWVLPGGGIDEKESIFKGIKRELKEEFNLRIRIIGEKFKFNTKRIEKIYSNPICSYKIELENNKKRIEHIFLAEIKNDIKEIKIQEDEIDKYYFFSLEEIINLEDTFEQIKEIASYIKNSDK